MRPSKRLSNQLRSIQLQRNFTKYAEGSVFCAFGDTQVLCTASIIEGIPRFLKGTGQGWLTAEYSMLPRATQQRTDREAAKGKQGGRTLEIQRLIGRALRTCVNLKKMGEHTITIDCDVIQADGGTRTAAITGSCVALYDALQVLQKRLALSVSPFKQFVAAVSVGMYAKTPVLDLDYLEDVQAETDMNVVMDDQGHFIEVQGTAEKKPFSKEELNLMLNLAQDGIQQLIKIQHEALNLN